jgi:hypothetical protein
METQLLEKRLAHLEADVATLKAHIPIPTIERVGVIGRTQPDKIEAIFGIYANDPEAEQVLKEIEETREKERRVARKEIKNKK